jgi:hypothetical protein
MKPQTQKYTDKVDAIRICRKLNRNLRRLTQSSEDCTFFGYRTLGGKFKSDDVYEVYCDAETSALINSLIQY